MSNSSLDAFVVGSHQDATGRTYIIRLSVGGLPLDVTYSPHSSEEIGKLEAALGQQSIVRVTFDGERVIGLV
jgi:hypothetical protein